MQTKIRDPDAVLVSSPMNDTTDELLDGVIERNGVCLRQLLALLRPLCLRQVRARLGQREPPEAADILNETESLLFEWSVDVEPHRRLPRGEPLGKLAWRLVNEVLQRRARQAKRQRALVEAVVTTADFPREAKPDEIGFGVERIARLILALPRADSEALTLELQHQLAGGPTVATALSLVPRAAEGRLYRARVKLLRALHESGLIDEQDDPENPDG
jgi:hypothetical protein